VDPSTLPTVNPTSSLTSAFVTVRVTGYSANAIDPDSGTAVGPGDYLQLVVYSTDTNLGNAPEYTDTVALPINSGPISGVQVTAPAGPFDIINFTIANLTAADVGTSISFETNATNQGTTGTSGNPLSVNSTGTEGGDVQIALPSVSTSALNLSGISVESSNVININNVVTGTDTNQYATADAEVRVQAAIDSISSARATVGAQAVSLQEDANDSAIQVVNQTASMSAIRDLDVGQAATQFTKDQVMSHIATSVLAQMQANAQLVVQLVSGLGPGTSGRV
jgi:flagellin-like hook-associated protein FlgL